LFTRRTFGGAACAAVLATSGAEVKGAAAIDEMYGLIGEMKAAPGRRAELIAALLEATQSMPGNLANIVAEDLADPDTIWITEVWRSRSHHQASLQLPGVRASIARARPLLAGFGLRREVRPVRSPA
jgi:quinol monooxygenase YgiN